MQFPDMKARVATGAGFIAALDQSGGSTPKALAGYGLAPDAWHSDAGMFALIHQMRCRIMTSPSFTGATVLGAILFEATMDGLVNAMPVPHWLAGRGIVPFVKIDTGLEAAADGVQLLRPIPVLADLLARARGLGVFGTKARSVIHDAHAPGIAAVVAQQCALGEAVLAAGLVPIIEPEINIASPTRVAADHLLRDALLAALDALPGAEQVMLKLSLPAVAGTFDALVDHPRVLRVVALSGGYSRAEACAELAQNRGIIASFSRALLDDLRAGMDDATFDATLAAAIAEINAASTTKG